MNGHDPVDDLLTRAFAADADRLAEGMIADRVMARIRRRRRLRTVVLGSALGVGVAVAVTLTAPAIGEVSRLLASLTSNPAPGWFDGAAIRSALPAAATLTLLLLGWLACLEEESGAL
jgi:hypothetical protein